MKVFTDPASEFNVDNPNFEFHLIGDWEIEDSEEFRRVYDQKQFIMRLTPNSDIKSKIEIVFDSPYDLQKFKEQLRIKNKAKSTIKKTIEIGASILALFAGSLFFLKNKKQ